MKQGFTLLEIIIIIIILSILVTLGIIQYGYVMESNRKAEAKISLGQLRKAEVTFYQIAQKYCNIADEEFGLGLPISPNCDPEHYFSYNCNPANGTCWATRCVSGSGGKNPNVPIDSAYTISLSIGGNFSEPTY